jgi:hypothetical protein
MVLDDSLETSYAFDNLYFDYQPDEDMIRFNEYSTNTVITDQYTDRAVLFSGTVEGQDPVVYDYGPDQWGRALHSYNWYGEILVRFVVPQNPETPRLVRYISFDNPIEPEIDYVNVKVYDNQDLLIYNYTSRSPERISVDPGKTIAAYMVLDDSLQTAGSYSVEWNAAGFPSGIYYYRLSTASGFIQTKN